MFSPLTLLAVALSYVWELLALPAHAVRLARLRLADRRTRFELRHALQQEQDALRAKLRVFTELERDILEVDLALEPSQRAAASAVADTLERLEQLATDRLGNDGRRGRPGGGRI